MADRHFKFVIATPTGIVAEDEAESIIVPGSDGYLGILANHAPLMTSLEVGGITYRDTSGYDHILAVTDGFLEVSNNLVTIIADAAEIKEEIDLDRARHALERAKERMNQASDDPNIDIERARAALRRAKNRIEIAEGQRKIK